MHFLLLLIDMMNEKSHLINTSIQQHIINRQTIERRNRITNIVLKPTVGDLVL